MVGGNLSIENIGGVANTGDLDRFVRKEKVDGSSRTFSDVLRDSVEKVNLAQSQADTAIKELVAGKAKNIHETLLTIERADASLRMMMQVRNKILDAYREIMRMQV
jgi:flagellar hook-basal body complex protein FliE